MKSSLESSYVHDKLVTNSCIIFILLIGVHTDPMRTTSGSLKGGRVEVKYLFFYDKISCTIMLVKQR
jgi:hypothetical protein